MERGTRTTVSKLLVGDRFYKTSDSKKTVWQIVEEKPKKTKYQVYQHFAIQDGHTYSAAIKAETPVIFLRHVTE